MNFKLFSVLCLFIVFINAARADNNETETSQDVQASESDIVENVPITQLYSTSGSNCAQNISTGRRREHQIIYEPHQTLFNNGSSSGEKLFTVIGAGKVMHFVSICSDGKYPITCIKHCTGSHHNVTFSVNIEANASVHIEALLAVHHHHRHHHHHHSCQDRQRRQLQQQN